MKKLLLIVVLLFSVMAFPASTSAGYAGPAAYYSSGYSGWDWCSIYQRHVSWGNSVGGGGCDPGWYFCVHPWHSPGEWLTVSANGTSISCFVADMVQPAHQAQWLSRWAIELSWPAFVALGLQHNNYAVVGLTAHTAIVEDAPEPQPRTFTEVPDSIDGIFLDFWEANGGLPIFGFPLTPPHTEADTGLTVQVFERAVMEDHDGTVLLRRLGAHSMGQEGP